MSDVPHWDLIPVDEYLEGELKSDVRHEYINGVVHAMAGSRNAHSMIAGNIFGQLYTKLSGNSCAPFNSDTKVRIQRRNDIRFYYPDAMVVCEQNSHDETFQDQPVVIFEVISDSTRRTDEEEKMEAYLSIPSLQNYVIVEQSIAAVLVYQRNDDGNFERFILSGIEENLHLPTLDITIPFGGIYERLGFTE